MFAKVAITEATQPVEKMRALSLVTFHLVRYSVQRRRSCEAQQDLGPTVLPTIAFIIPSDFVPGDDRDGFA